MERNRFLRWWSRGDSKIKSTRTWQNPSCKKELVESSWTFIQNAELDTFLKRQTCYQSYQSWSIMCPSCYWGRNLFSKQHRPTLTSRNLKDEFTDVGVMPNLILSNITATYTDIHRPDFSKRDIWSCIYSMWKKNNCLISEHAATGETFLSQSPADVLPKELPSSAWTCSCLWCGERGTVLMKTSMTQVFVCHSHCPLTLFWYWNMAGNASVQTDTSSPCIWELS